MLGPVHRGVGSAHQLLGVEVQQKAGRKLQDADIETGILRLHLFEPVDQLPAACGVVVKACGRWARGGAHLVCGRECATQPGAVPAWPPWARPAQPPGPVAVRLRQ